jgi:hypothetical protein
MSTVGYVIKDSKGQYQKYLPNGRYTWVDNTDTATVLGSERIVRMYAKRFGAEVEEVSRENATT